MLVTDALNYFSNGYLFQEKSYTSGETLIKELLQHYPCKILIEEALNVIQELGLAALEVRLEPTKSGFDAENESNVIRIEPNLSANYQRFALIFELTNLIQHKKNLESYNSAIKGIYKNEEEYTRAMECIEYDGLQRTNVVSRAINKQSGRFFRSYIENPNEDQPLESMGFDAYYSFYLQDNHKEYYRRKWRDLNNIKNRSNSCIEIFANSIYNNTIKIALGVALSISVIAMATLKWE